MKLQVRYRFTGILHYISEHWHLPNIPESFFMMLVQLAGAFAVLYGISWYSIPMAYIVGGVGAIAAIELQNHVPKTDPAEDALIKQRIDTALRNSQNPFDQPGVTINQKWLTYVALMARKLK